MDCVVSRPRFGHDTYSRHIRDTCETVCEMVCEIQAEAICTISMRLALGFPR